MTPSDSPAPGDPFPWFGPDLFTCDQSQVTEAAVRRFVEHAIATRLQAESLVIEFKSRQRGSNVVTAVAAMSNTDGGLVFVGVQERGPDHFEGSSREEVDAIVSTLRAKLPSAFPEVIPVAMAGGGAIVVIRVDPDAVDHPVVVDGRVFVRVPGQSVGARRDEVIALVARGTRLDDSAPRGMPLDVASVSMWRSDDAQLEFRVGTRSLLPRSALTRRLGTKAIEAVEASLHEFAPVPNDLATEHARAGEVLTPDWEVVETASTRAFLVSAPSRSTFRGRPSFTGACRVALLGRHLEVLVAVRADLDDGQVERAPLRLVHEALLGAAVSACQVAGATAATLGAHSHGTPRLEGWIGGTSGLCALQAEAGWRRAPTPSRPDWRLSPAQPVDTTVTSLALVVRRWLEETMLDAGALGIEDSVSAVPLPRWAVKLRDGDARLG